MGRQTGRQTERKLRVLPWQVKHLTWKWKFCTRTTSPLQSSRQRRQWIVAAPRPLLLLGLPPLCWYGPARDHRRGVVRSVITSAGQLLYCTSAQLLAEAEQALQNSNVHNSAKNKGQHLRWRIGLKDTLWNQSQQPEGVAQGQSQCYTSSVLMSRGTANKMYSTLR